MSEEVFGVPNSESFFGDTPLYEKFYYDDSYDGAFAVLEMLCFKRTIDTHCTSCGRESPFKLDLGESFSSHAAAIFGATGRNFRAVDILPIGIHRITLACTRNGEHKHVFFVRVGAEFEAFGDPKQPEFETHFYLQKVGQLPSLADLSIPGVKKYARVLGKDRQAEFVRAIGLAAHGVGIGSYVYLRRVFESLVEEAHVVAREQAGWDEEKYTSGRMAERIALLTDHLPTFLVEHARMYTILSKGVHELSEGDCLKHFPTLKIGIELILDEKLEQTRKERKIEEAKQALGDAINEIRKP